MNKYGKKMLPTTPLAFFADLKVLTFVETCVLCLILSKFNKQADDSLNWETFGKFSGP